MLPSLSTAMIGREAEFAEFERLLAAPEARLITISGPGGVGKTTLAIAAATGRAAQLDLPVAWVPVEDEQDTAGLVSAIARAIGVRERGGRAPLEILKSRLRRQPALLLLD